MLSNGNIRLVSPALKTAAKKAAKPKGARKPRTKKPAKIAAPNKVAETENPTELPQLDPNGLEPNTYYWALLYGEKEIILTNCTGKYFYIHGDEYIRKSDGFGVKFVKKIWTRPAPAPRERE